MIRIAAEGHLQVDGVISVNGSTGPVRGGASSGGSIWLTSHTVGGSSAGLLHVRGGDATFAYSGAGGGGRIAVHYDPAAGSPGGCRTGKLRLLC